LGGLCVTNGIYNPPLPQFNAVTATPEYLDPNQTLITFLTGNVYTNFQGFSNLKQSPFAVPLAQGETRVGPFLDFPQNKFALARANAKDLTTIPSVSAKSLIDPWETPYAYFASIQGNDYGNLNDGTPIPGGPAFIWISPGGFTTSVAPFATPSGTLVKYI